MLLFFDSDLIDKISIYNVRSRINKCKRRLKDRKEKKTKKPITLKIYILTKTFFILFFGQY